MISPFGLMMRVPASTILLRRFVAGITEKVDLALYIRLVFIGVSVKDLLPFSGKVLVVRTIREYCANRDDNLCIATKSLKHNEDFADLAISRHGFPPGSRSEE